MIRTILHKYSGAWLSPIPLQPRTGSAIVVKTQGMRGKKDPLEQVAASAPQGSVCGTTSRFNISVVASVLDKGLFCSVKMLEVSDGTIRPSQAQGDRQDLAYTNTCSIPALKMLVGEERRGFIGPEDVAAATDCDGVGGMVGAGIFSLPRTFANATGPFGAVIAWLIAGTGMYMLARVFQSLAERKPDLDAGVFAYAKAGFGDYPGFLSAFGYWIGSCIGNVSYWVLIKATLGAFFPVFGNGNTVTAIIVASIGIWLFHFMILKGVQQAAFINSIVTVAKIIPILVFIVILIFAFKADMFQANFYGGDLTGSLFEQVRATMLVTVFVFLGIEGASVYSRYAKKRSDVGAATIAGFIGVTSLMVLVTMLPYAVLKRLDIAGMRQPSMASVLESVVGHWGAIFVSVGLIVSVLGAYLAWSLICAEVLFAAAKTEDMPKIFATENANKVPAAALWLTNIVVQLFVISTYFSQDAFHLMLSLTSAMTLIPYLFVAAYGF